jgi:RHS repeat-associated protein
VGAAQAGYAFTGREWDPETGFYNYRARYYAPGLGRFVSEDPIGFKGGLNLYGYVDGDPVNWADPSGLCPCRVTVRCRPVHHPVPEKVSKVSGGTVVPVHCYIVGTSSSGGNTTYTGGPTKSGGLGAWAQPGFPSNPDDSVDDPIIWQGEVPCDKLDCLQKATQSFNNQKHKYDPVSGPNSNSAAGGMAFACQIPATFPGGAFGSNYFRP